MRLVILSLFLIFLSFIVKSQSRINLEQDTLKSNPIIFSDFLIGYALGKAGGITISPTLNYQKNRILFTARYVGSASFFSIPNRQDFLFPFLRKTETKSITEEFSLLTGYKTLISRGASISFSGGISRNKFKYYGPEGSDPEFRDYYLGVPFETSLLFFNRRKERFRIYGLIPVGKPNGLSNSYGLKLYGNISRNSFIGLGLNLGYGFHKKY
jgi:hypothetical protein